MAAKSEDGQPFPGRRVLQDGLHYSQCFLVSTLLLRSLKGLDCTLILTEGQNTTNGVGAQGERDTRGNVSKAFQPQRFLE